MTSNHSVVIEELPNRGNVLVTTELIECGTTIIIEKPVVIIPPAFGNTPPFKSDRIGVKLFQDYNYFLTLSSSLRELILSFYCPLESFWSKTLRQECSSLMSNSDVEDFVKLNTVCHFNAVSVNPQPLDGSTATPVNLGSGLFLLCCRMSHSCNPNCYWYSAQNGDRVVRSIRKILPNEELTIDYLAEVEILSTTVQRQEILFQTYEFICHCDLCSEVGDRLRQFNCIKSPKCSGSHKRMIMEWILYQDFYVVMYVQQQLLSHIKMTC